MAEDANGTREERSRSCSISDRDNLDSSVGSDSGSVLDLAPKVTEKENDKPHISDTQMVRDNHPEIAVVMPESPGLESPVTQAPKVTSDSGPKTAKSKPKRVTSDSGKKANRKKVLPFKEKKQESLVTQAGMKWEIAPECGCYLPKEKGYEWRKFENGHRLLLLIGYGLSKNGKRTKRRDQFRYFTHSALKMFVEREYGIQTKHVAEA